ncbi:hypothetical protein Val02_02350 [Virgisporangium aliadipatigenens]|uniref:Cardiolipin synthase N-terminal domain-containing protein n=1 Tax=Virgisporangium aliadipatigenens TaxID=741659 RepID=A0A8J3YDY3_9ACTN|nr:PLD nuclease N-terminal domain-containing protein [Virgisporangium aliadipatigenens]GIJ43349.1 hypothetical protein Val02_02350 [Virgisporangium aliadipatigenens]
MGRLYPLLFLIHLALLLFALIDCLSRDEYELRALPKVVWVLLILLFSPIGAIAYLIAGRPERAARAVPTWASGSGFPERERPRPVAPDDDPEFLRGLAAQRREDEDLLRRWEDDLRRREERLRDRETPPEQ